MLTATVLGIFDCFDLLIAFQLQRGDVIDVVKGFDPIESDKLIVSRIEILDIAAIDNALKSVAVRKHLSLKIDNYAGDDIFESSSLPS